jgi:hypothetical protein
MTTDFTYCGDRLTSHGILYQQGTGGALSDMDIDCDGTQGSAADDGDANIHPYVVFGNVGSHPGYANFDPRDYGVEPLSVMAVVCGDKLVGIPSTTSSSFSLTYSPLPLILPVTRRVYISDFAT